MQQRGEELHSLLLFRCAEQASQKENPFIKGVSHQLGKGHYFYFSYMGMVGVKVNKRSHGVGNTHH